MMTYNKLVREYFFSPLHVGSVDLNQSLAQVIINHQKGQGCIEFYIQCDIDGVIGKACFKTNGNPYLIAGLEWLCRELIGKKIKNMPVIDYHVLIKELEIPITQYPLALRVVDVFKKMIMLFDKM